MIRKVPSKTIQRKMIRTRTTQKREKTRRHVRKKIRNKKILKFVTGEGLLSERVVLQLCDGLLDSKRTLYTDNFYTSVSLARKLLRRKTHLVGTLRGNRKHNPTAVITKNLRRSEMIVRQTRGITVSK